MGKAREKQRGRKSSDRIKIGRIARTRKDGEEIRFKDYNNEKRSGRFAPACTLFGAPSTDDRPPLISIVPEANFPGFDTEEEFYNLYFEDGVTITIDVDAVADAAKARKNGGTKKPAKRKAEEEDEEESSDDEDEDDPFAA